MILTPSPTAHQDSQVFVWHESMGGQAAEPFSDPENDQSLLNGQLLDADLERFDVDVFAWRICLFQHWRWATLLWNLVYDMITAQRGYIRWQIQCSWSALTCVRGNSYAYFDHTHWGYKPLAISIKDYACDSDYWCIWLLIDLMEKLMQNVYVWPSWDVCICALHDIIFWPGNLQG